MRRVISVTRRHLEFLFPAEEKVMCAVCERPGVGDDCKCECHAWKPADLFAEGDWQLPSTDDCHVGDDV